jgi:hypothetical protein
LPYQVLSSIIAREAILQKAMITGSRRKAHSRICGPLLLLILLIPACIFSEGRLPGSEIILPEEDVKDRFFAYMIGLAEADAYGNLTADDFSNALREFAGETRVPFELITSIERRRPERGGPTLVSISFLEKLKTPVPYSILGYHPGSVVADTTVRLYEYYLPVKSIWVSRDVNIRLTQVHVFAIYEGYVVVDIDAWVDKLLGGHLDDTWLTVLALFKYEGVWHGLAAGYGPSGEGRSGVFNFQTNEILFPTPERFRTLGPHFRNFVRSTKHVHAPVPGHGKWVEK